MVISKRIRRPKDPERPVADNYRALAEYISNDNKEQNEDKSEVFDFDDYKHLADYMAASDIPETTTDARITDRAEKLHSLWIENCEAGDSLEFLNMAIAEIEATQDQNRRTRSEKTYHLLTSFRKEDGVPSESTLRDMEQEFAKALGYTEHQRVVACHQDTDNFHFHVAYNRVHPENFKCHSPSWDYYKRDEVCREMEKKHGLAIDNGVKSSKDEKQTKTPSGARDMEAHRWEESFNTYVCRHKGELVKCVEEAKSWQDVHKGFAEYDLELKTRNNGLVIASKSDKRNTIKASSIDRSLSKPSLEKRFGTFQVPKQDAEEKKPKDTYKPRPTTKHQGQSKLWDRYRRDKKAWHKGWKSFLMQMALVQDPLAIAIIMTQKKMIEGLLSPNGSLPTPHYRESLKKEQRFYVSSAMQYPKAEGGILDNTIPRSKRDEGKKLGARWDRDKKSWYATSKEAILSLELLSVKAKLAQERNKAEKLAQKEAAKVYLMKKRTKPRTLEPDGIMIRSHGMCNHTNLQGRS